jgi:aconitase A
LHKEIEEILNKTPLVGVAVTSADRNFEGRVHPLIRAHYLGSPGLVVAWAIAGRIDLNLEQERLGVDKEVIKNKYIEKFLNICRVRMFFCEIFGLPDRK